MLIANSPQLVFEGTLTFAEVASSTSTTADQTVTLPTGVTFPSGGGTGGANSGFVHLELPDLDAGLSFCNVHVLSRTTFSIRFRNETGGAITPVGTNARLVQF